MSEQPILVAYDGSEHAKAAIEQAAAVLAPRPAVVLLAWQPIETLPGFALSGGFGGVDIASVDEQTQQAAAATAAEGAELARQHGLTAEPQALRAVGPLWQAIVRRADELDAAVIVLGSRGLTGVRHALLGSVSEGVARHADRPTLIVHPPAER